MSIPQIMKMIPSMHLDSLMVAFESGSSHYYEWSPGRYLGIYTDGISHLQCEQKAGDWREGRIIKLKVPNE